MVNINNPKFVKIMGPGLISKARKRLLPYEIVREAARHSSDMSKFRESLKAAKNVAFITGAGISAESGIPTYRGAGRVWRKYSATSLEKLEAFQELPSLVWEFYQYRRREAARAQPNAGHIAIAEYEKKYGSAKIITIVTQNIDNLHAKACSRNILELHGSMFKTRCTKCNEVLVNTDSPICPVSSLYHRSQQHPALANISGPEPKAMDLEIADKDLPHCKKPDCKGLLRPHVVWFGERLEKSVTDKADETTSACEVCLVVGTSSLVYPAAGYASLASARGAVVAEFNLEKTPTTADYSYFFQGFSSHTLPLALAD